MVARALHRKLIETQELASLLRNSSPVHILDATYNIPGMTGDVKQQHFDRRIPGARFFEIDEIADKSVNLPHMMPSDELFIDYMKKLRMKNDDNLLVVYDQHGNISSPRVWYTFKVFGRENVALLNGGLPKWIKEGHPTTSGAYSIYDDPTGEPDSDYRYSLDTSKIISYTQIKEISKRLTTSDRSNLTQILDARPPGRFEGKVPEPRAGVASGHVPGSMNLFFKNLLNEEGCYKSPEELAGEFSKAGINLKDDSAVVHCCGSGMTACINILGMELAGKSNNKLYDGSWTEYVISTQGTLLKK